MIQAIKETKIHGNIDFPYSCFSGRIPQLFKEFPIHYHEMFEIVFIAKGTMKVVLEDTVFFPHKADILFIPPKTEHGYFQHKNEECFYYTILFDMSLIESDENSAIYKKYIAPYKEKARFKEYFIRRGSDFTKHIFPAVLYLIRHRHERYTTNELMVKSKLCELLFQFKKILVEDELQNMKNREHIAITRLKQVFMYIYKNFNRKLSIQEIAQYAGYSECYFMTLFKKTTNLTVVNFINQIRIAKARQLLCDTDFRISEIAMQVGFTNFSYFIRSFKDKYGMSPSQFRKSKEFAFRIDSAFPSKATKPA